MRFLIGSSVLAVFALLPVACDSDPNVKATGDGDGGDGDSAGDGDSGTGDGDQGEGGESGLGAGINCGGGCEDGTYCASNNECLPEGSCASDSDCGAAELCNSDGECELGSECGQETFEIEAVPPNLLVLLDRSCSMPLCSNYDNATQGSNCYNTTGVDKWAEAVGAINALTSTFPDGIRWGLELFPDAEGDSCGQEPPAVLPGDGTGAQVSELLTAALDDTNENFPTGPCVTNILGVVQHATGLTELQDPERDNYLVLITDGDEWGCGQNGNDEGSPGYNAQTVEALEDAAEVGLNTFVIGFGGGTDEDVMNEFAEAGGVPSDGDQKFLQANNSEQLQVEMGAIIGQIATCDFNLDKTATDPDRLFVFSDEAELERDTDYTLSNDGNALTFLGATCDAIKSDDKPDIEVIFACPDDDVR